MPNAVTIHDEEEEIHLLVPIGEWDDDVISAFKYLAMKDRKWPMWRIAKALGWEERKSLYNNLPRWHKNGALEKARELYYIPMVEDVNAARREVIAAYPELLMTAVKLAQSSQSDFVRLQAIDWLKRNVIDQEIIEQTPAGAAEAAWAKKPADFNPTEIPAFISKVGE